LTSENYDEGESKGYESLAGRRIGGEGQKRCTDQRRGQASFAGVEPEKSKFGSAAGHAMSLRKEVKEYIRSCDHLLVDAALSTTAPFSPEDCGSIEYYTAEVMKLISSNRCRDESIVI
jgi:hypothetical protein